MKLFVMAAAAMMLAAATSNVAYANADDAKWVGQCVQDNSDAKVGVEIVTKYCNCMNNQMSDKETRTITQWEKSHPKERHECERQAGWN
jgi:hypothetical protein